MPHIARATKCCDLFGVDEIVSRVHVLIITRDDGLGKMSDRTAQPLKINIKLHFSFQMLCSVKKCIWCPAKVCEKCGLLPALMATALVFWPKNALYAGWLEM